MIKREEINFKPLTNNDLNSINKFETYEPELKKFLIEDALDNQKLKISKTYLLFHKDNLAGYITLLADALKLESHLKTFFKEKGINYKSLPALKIGRLAVDNRFLRQKLGTIMLEFAYSIAKNTSDKLFGCRFLILDVKRNSDPKKDPIHFYKKFNFKILKERQKGTIPMYLDLHS
jgi:GNAT superfamily N-acetyltransferase